MSWGEAGWLAAWNCAGFVSRRSRHVRFMHINDREVGEYVTEKHRGPSLWMEDLQIRAGPNLCSERLGGRD